MRQEQFWLAAAMVVGAIFVVKRLADWHGQSRRLRVRRFEVLAESLRDPTLDPTTRAELLRAIARDHRGAAGWLAQRLQSPALWRTLWFGAGWFGLLINGALLVMALTRVSPWYRHLEPIVMALVCSFGMLTLPLALRELTRRETLPGR
jgi:hypothetical protein